MFLLDGTIKLACGTATLTVNPMILELTTALMNLIKIGVPILLIFFGMLDLGKAVMAQKEDEIKKGQQTFVKRLIAAVIVFLVVFIVQIVVSLVTDDNDESSIWHCVECIINYSETDCKAK